MDQDLSKVTEIVGTKEVEPAIYLVSVVYQDGATDMIRMSVFDLNALKARLGLPIEH